MVALNTGQTVYQRIDRRRMKKRTIKQDKELPDVHPRTGAASRAGAGYCLMRSLGVGGASSWRLRSLLLWLIRMPTIWARLAILRS